MSDIVEKNVCPNRNKFCYVCGLFTAAKNSRNLSDTIIKLYETFFDTKYLPNPTYAPEIICGTCRLGLSAWEKDDKDHRMKFVTPMGWLLDEDHDANKCYCCRTNVDKIRGIDRENIPYARNLKWIIAAQKRSKEIPFSHGEIIASSKQNPSSDVDMPSASVTSSSESEQTAAQKDPLWQTSADKRTKAPTQLISNEMFEDLVRDLRLFPELAEVLGSRLKEWNLTDSGFVATSGRARGLTEKFDSWYRHDEINDLYYCHDVDRLFNELGHPHKPDEWRLFIDSSVNSLKGKNSSIFILFFLFVITFIILIEFYYAFICSCFTAYW